VCKNLHLGRKDFGLWALLAAGPADVTFTLTAKREWDIAAGAALVLSSGGMLRALENRELQCNQQDPLLPGMIACSLSAR
jgi:3'-phosphoadenosine 5'-phosphosulfate (PAPS) 3'-phosphatase